MKTVDYAFFTIKLLESEFNTSLSRGLSQQQAALNQTKYGFNALEEQEASTWSIFIRQFNNPFVYLLGAAAALSFFLGDHINSITISAILLVNSSLSFFQEYKADQALQLLQKHLTMKATAVREGAIITLDNKELVPGDIVLLKTGDYVPADIVLCEGSVQVNESVITGESVPLEKSSIPHAELQVRTEQPINVCFFSTTITSGSARGIVVATGSDTMFGEIGRLTVQTIRQSGFQERIKRLSLFILSLVAFTLITLFIINLVIHPSQTSITQLLLFSTALALGLTPEALPAVITFALSRGALQLAEHNVIVKRLSAIEDLGAIAVLCTDKTGTLTENNLSVQMVYEEKKDSVLPAMVFAAKHEGFLDPFDNALIKAAPKELREKRNSYTIIKEVPFDPKVQRNSILLEKNKERLLIVRGSFESIRTLTTIPPKDEEKIQAWINERSAEGNRILAVASKIGPLVEKDEHHDGYTFLGLVAFADAVKKSSYEAIKKAHSLGIAIKMITGDSPEVAKAVAREIELPGEAITGTQFEQLSVEEKKKVVESYTIFSRMLPQQKYEIVQLLKENSIVGFLGEGINDAPALKAAHIGLVVEGATDIAQDAADIILLNKSLLVIVKGIGIGRAILSNTMKYIKTVVSSTFGNCCSIALASVFLNFLPLLPLQILLLNMLCDIPMIAITTDTLDPHELKEAPHYNLRSLASFATVLGLTSSVFDMIMFALFYPQGPAAVQTNWFIGGILTELTLIYSVRTKRAFYKAPPPSFLLISISVLCGLIAVGFPFTSFGQTVFKFITPQKKNLIQIAVVVISYFFTTDLVKRFYYRYTKQRGQKKQSPLV